MVENHAEAIFPTNVLVSQPANVDTKKATPGESAEITTDTPHPFIPSIPQPALVTLQPASRSSVEHEEKPPVVQTEAVLVPHTSANPEHTTSGAVATPIAGDPSSTTPVNPSSPEKVKAIELARAYHRLNLDQETDFWVEYGTQAGAFDRQLVKTLSSDLENLLIFVSSLQWSRFIFNSSLDRLVSSLLSTPRSLLNHTKISRLITPRSPTTSFALYLTNLVTRPSTSHSQILPSLPQVVRSGPTVSSWPVFRAHSSPHSELCLEDSGYSTMTKRTNSGLYRSKEETDIANTSARKSGTSRR